MAPQPNQIDVQALGEAKSIDFVNRLGESLNKLFEALNITNKLPMNVGTALKQYRFSVNPEGNQDGIVAEGDVIPLTKVERELVDITELTFKKFRKATTAESIQAHGFSTAVNRTDDEMLRYVQKQFRTDFFNMLKAALTNKARTNKAKLSAPNLQGALAKGRANLSVLLDTEITPIALVNPNDVAGHLAEGLINSDGSEFGMNLLTRYVGAKVIEFSDVPEGEVWFTVSENLNVAYANPNGDLSLAFPFSVDQTGFVGVLHDMDSSRLTSETVLMHAISMFPENIDAVVKVTITPPTTTTATA